MNKTTRYNLLANLNGFYVKEVKPNIAGFNKARILSNVSYFLCWCFFCYLTFCLLVFFPIVSIFYFFGYNFDDTYFFDSGLAIGLFAGLFVFFAVSEVFLYIAKIVDKNNNIIHIFNHSESGVSMPIAADYAIKEHLMCGFFKIFEDFSRIKYDGYKNTCLNNEEYVKTLGILNVPFLDFDDFLTGRYQGININIAEPRFSPVTIGSILLFGFYFCLIIGLFGAILGVIGLFQTAYLFISKHLIYILLTGLLVLALIFIIRYLTSKPFRGLLVEIDMNKNFKGHTFILERNNIKDNKMVNPNIYSEVKLEDIEFEKEFRIWSQNQIEARYILTTALVDRIKTIKRIFKAQYIRVSFKDKKIVIAIHTGRDMFQVAGANSITKETFNQLFNEICEILDLVDTLKLNEKIGL